MSKIKSAIISSIASLLLVMLLMLTLVRVFHHHEIRHHSLLSNEFSVATDACQVCEFFVHKLAKAFTLSKALTLHTYRPQFLRLVHLFVQEAAMSFLALPTNKAPPL